MMCLTRYGGLVYFPYLLTHSDVSEWQQRYLSFSAPPPRGIITSQSAIRVEPFGAPVYTGSAHYALQHMLQHVNTVKEDLYCQNAPLRNAKEPFTVLQPV